MFKKIFASRQNLISVSLGLFISLAFAFQFVPFLTPLILAIIFAFALTPKVNRFGFRTAKRRLPTIAVLIVFFVAIVAPVTFIFHRIIFKAVEATKGGLENTQLYQSLERIKDKILNGLSNLSPDLVEGMGADGNGLKKASDWIVAASGSFAAALPDMILAFFVFMAALYFFIVESKHIKIKFQQLDILHASKFDRIVEITQRVCYSTLVTSIIIGMIQAAVVTLGAFIFGYGELVLIYIFTFIVSFIPVVGAGPVAFVLALNSFLIGENGKGIGLLVVSGIAGAIDNIIKPFLVANSDEKDVHPIISILAFVGAVVVYGFPGLLIGPVLLQLAVSIVPILFEMEDSA